MSEILFYSASVSSPARRLKSIWATIYMTLDRPGEALGELEKVRDAAPREASVHFSMGKVYKRLGDVEKAMRCFLTALDLDPKDNNMIKASMDRLEEPDVEEDVGA